MAPIAQLDRALPSEGRGHKFESCWVHHFNITTSGGWAGARLAYASLLCHKIVKMI